MKVFNTIAQMQEFSADARRQGKAIGFVPTMGALHQGHLDLMRQAKKENTYLVVSIFVNPIQFNNPEDLEKYPRDLNRDLDLLKTVACDVVFAPTVSEMYPETVTEKHDFGALEQVMEGATRPGHFNGVAVVVKKLFEIVQPLRAYFGEKDYQQLLVIKKLVQKEHFPVQVIPCAIVREPDGLAMSSRNTRLNAEERALAPRIYQILREAKQQAAFLSPEALQMWGEDRFREEKSFDLVYFQLADDTELQPVNDWKSQPGVLAFVALQLGSVRLIDNIRII